MRRLVSVGRAPQTTPDSDGFFEPLSPPTWWAEIEDLEPIVSDGTRTRSYRVRGRFHSGITVDTRLLYHDADVSRNRELFVKGIQTIDRAQMVLYCEETTP